ncbi:hypothetical protein BK659_23585, partial [Pseudomonas brassicacearum]
QAPAGLGMTYAPLLKQPIPVPEGLQLSWSVTGANNSGLFTLRAVCANTSVPLTLESRVISRTLLVQEITRIEVRGRPVSEVGAIFFREEQAEFKLTFEPGMQGLAVLLEDTDAPVGMVYVPALRQLTDVPQGLTLSWNVTGGKVSGSFALKLSCAGVTTALTLTSRVMSKLTSDAFESITLNGETIDDLSKPDLVFFRAGTHVLELKPKSGGPLPEMKVALIAGDINPNLGITYTPPLGESHTQDIPENGSVKWTIIGGSQSGFFDLQFKFTETDEVFPLPCRVLSKNLNDEAEVTIRGETVPAEGNFFLRGQAQTVTLKLKPGSPLDGYPVTLTCAIKSGLVAANVVSVPAFDAEKTTHSWDVTGSTKSGTFQLSLTGKDMTTPITVALSTLLSASIEDEATVQLDGSDIFWRGRPRILTLVPNTGSPIAGAPVVLRWVTGSGLETKDLKCSPELGDPTTIHSWTITGSAEKSGSFLLDLILEGSNIPMTLSTSVLLSSDFADEVTPKLDDIVIPIGGAVFPGGITHQLTLEPKANSPLAYMPVSLQWGGSSSLNAEDFKCNPNFNAHTLNLQWAITGDNNKRGDFSLKLLWIGLSEPMLLPTLKLQ